MQPRLDIRQVAQNGNSADGTREYRDGGVGMQCEEQYGEAGFFVARGLLGQRDFLPVEETVIEKIAKHYAAVESLNAPDWVAHSLAHPECVTKIYDEMRDHEVFIDLGRSAHIVSVVEQLIRQPVLYEKVPFRIDVPFETKELAFWHQDDFYVQGNDEELTAWIPMFDTCVQHGALQIMPYSHKLGKIPHTMSVGKKSLPVGVYHHEIRYVEMSRGDVLFFSPLLLHSSSLNISDQIRYSIQLRYTTSLKDPSTIMRGTVGV